MGLTLYTLADAERIIAAGLHRIRHVDTVIGVPRSGQIFAAFIATQLGCALADVATAGRSIRVAKHGHVVQEDLGRVLLVEDIVNKGIAIQGAIDVMRTTAPGVKREQITTCSIWTNPGTPAGAVDIDLGGAHAPRYSFSWQMWHSALWPQWATDMDGVLCEDPPAATADDEVAYQAWTRSAVARWLPRPRRGDRYKVGAIITSRPEGVRASTVTWLVAHGIQYEKLIMAPGRTQADAVAFFRQTPRGTWKAREAAKAGIVELFVESSAKQAQKISVEFPGLVWCTDTQQRFSAGAPA